MIRRAWERFRERKANQYGSFGVYAENRLFQLSLGLVVLLIPAVIASGCMPIPGVMS